MKRDSLKFAFDIPLVIGGLTLLAGCSSATNPRHPLRYDIELCPEIRLATSPKSRLAFYGPSSYRDKRVVPTMIVSMSSDDVIAEITKRCPSPLNVSQFHIELFKEYPIRSGDSFFREQQYVVSSNEYFSVHAYCQATILVWFNPDGSIQGLYNGLSLC